MSSRKRVVLPITDKIKIIESLKKGESGRLLADKYGVGTSTISDIKKNAESILNYKVKIDSQDGSINRKAMKDPPNKLLEDAVYSWFLQKRSTGRPISGPLLREKALDLNKKLGGSASFLASNGWLLKFKNRHGIRELEIQGEKMSADTNSANSFKDDFKKTLNEGDYDLDFVYNADETGLNWKLLPSKSLASCQENSAPGHNSSKERVTILVCANASVSHRMPLLLIGKSKKPRLKKFQNEIGKQGKVLLLLDNAPTHPSVETLERENGMFKVIFLPPNVTSLLQPMDQSVIETLKRLYRKELLRRLLSVDDDTDAQVVLTFFKQMNLKECCYMLVSTWDLVQRKTLNKAWNKILNRNEENPAEDTDNFDSGEISEIIKDLQICQECDSEDLEELLSCDSNDQGFQIMSDDEIVNNLLQANNQKEICEDETEKNESEENDAEPSHSDAFQALETALQWFEKQEECDTVSLLRLKQIRDIGIG
ncbi:jerky protein homolog-like [Leptopilina boulardi]|uniref:jerky protein homolog-like n=1 Tax=Leptopilina boulardi TaxID=63433 RepID=UPI0021F63096|nr:jerky protein homolog-like [Leptopilina boulardi]